MNARRIKHVLVTYFTCTRTEKHAAIVLGGLLLVIQGYLYVRHHVMHQQDGPALAKEQQAASVLQANPDYGTAGISVSRRAAFRSIALHTFNPNSTDSSGFVQLGMTPRQAASLIRYRDKIGGFQSKADMKRVRVLDSELFSQWAPYIQLPEHSPGLLASRAAHRRIDKAGLPERKSPPPKKRLVIDLNEADTLLLKELPLVGSGRARAIASYRERLGGFVSPDQLLEIKAIPDSVYQQLLPCLTIKPGPLRKLEINRLPVDSMRHHPYIGKQFARMIVSYRDQHGPFSSLDDLLKLPLADEEILRKLAPYLIF